MDALTTSIAAVVAAIFYITAIIIPTYAADSSNSSTKFLTYKDTDFGFTIQYPQNWNKTAGQQSATLIAFNAPDNKGNVVVRFYPKGENETLKGIGDNFKHAKDQYIAAYYRNSTTKLSGLPAIKAYGTYFGSVTKMQEALGYSAKSSKFLIVSTLSENRNGFFSVLFTAPDKPTFDKYRPMVDKMISSFHLDNKKPVIQEEG